MEVEASNITPAQPRIRHPSRALRAAVAQWLARTRAKEVRRTEAKDLRRCLRTASRSSSSPPKAEGKRNDNRILGRIWSKTDTGLDVEQESPTQDRGCAELQNALHRICSLYCHAVQAWCLHKVLLQNGTQRSLGAAREVDAAEDGKLITRIHIIMFKCL